ncbi:MAG: tRNA lysidine(34) synthetase TilS [Paracoccaceae bacterium]|nr:tRNA lysidine(34) synthetase TilS [Paracoccaceae bacterium]
MTSALTQLVETAFDPDAPPRVGVAVSGGGDSMALLTALAGRYDVAAVTVDHGLRPEATEEAAFVARYCAQIGVPHSILRWEGPDATGNLMDQARRARLRLIGAWARGQGLAHVALGHTADDQAETFLMRLAREAGLEGLAGMRPRFEAEGVVWHRPFLRASRADLRAYLTGLGVAWVDDPSNANDRFDRVKARKALASLAPLGLNAAILSATVDHLAVAERALRATLGAWAEAHVTTPMGDVVIDPQGFAALEPELQRRLMNAALRWVSGADYPPRAAKLGPWLAAPRTATLHGCKITLRSSEIRITREVRAVAGLRVTPDQIWDRWRLDGPATPGAQIAALGAEGVRCCPGWRDTGLPRASLLATPAVWQGETLVAAPLAGLENGWKAQIACGSFLSMLFRR